MEMKTVLEPEWHPVDLQPPEARPWAQAAKAGDVCPICREELLDYDGILNLVCPKCGPVECGCFT